jgi:hypothetical protein
MKIIKSQSEGAIVLALNGKLSATTVGEFNTAVEDAKLAPQFRFIIRFRADSSPGTL